MEVYRSEMREILKRFFEDRISRAESMDALDSALVALVPRLAPAELQGVQAILAEDYRLPAENPSFRIVPTVEHSILILKA